MKILKDIPFEFDVGALSEYLRIEPGTEAAGEFATLLDEARAIGRPKAAYRESYVEARGDDTVSIDGIMFTSRVLRMNLDRIERVFPYVATCGEEIDLLEVPADDFIKRYWIDVIKEALLSASNSYLKTYLHRKYRLDKTSVMNPGSGDATVWPIEQQRQLFSLLGDVKGAIGVELTDSYLMVPLKSVSGIRFPTEIDFESCQLCHRRDCPSRVAPFNKELWDSWQGDADQGV